MIRIVLSSGYRMVYPFLAVFSRGLGVDLTAISLVLTARSLTGLASPFLAPISDLRGRKVGMLLGLGIFIAGAGLVALWPSFPTFFLALILGSLGNYVFLPATQAYIGDRVAYHQRGRAMAITELNWSAAFFLGVPLAGFLIARFGWRSPFPILAGLGIAAFALVAALIPNDAPARMEKHEHRPGLWHAFGTVLTCPPAQAALAMSLLMTTANEVVNVVFGVWMENSFGLQIAALGAASAVLGLAELSGELASSAWVDRLGKQRATAIGLALNCVSALAIPLLGHSPVGAVTALFFFYLTFEFSIVCYIPLVSGVLPSARATLLAANLAAFSLGRAIGDVTAPFLFTLGIFGCAAAAVVANGLALVALLRVKVQE